MTQQIADLQLRPKRVLSAMAADSQSLPISQQRNKPYCITIMMNAMSRPLQFSGARVAPATLLVFFFAARHHRGDGRHRPVGWTGVALGR